MAEVDRYSRHRRGAIRIAVLPEGHERYPSVLYLCPPGERPGALFVIGSVELLSREKLALICSSRCSGAVILKTYDFAKQTNRDGPVIVSGFHSPMERQCLEVLLARKIPLIICPARSLERMRVPAGWLGPIAEQRLMVISPFRGSTHRITRQLSGRRNRFVSMIAERVLIPYAHPGGQAEEFARLLVTRRKPLLTFDDEPDNVLLSLGARLAG